MPREHITEKNAYAYINVTLKDLGWDTRNPNRYPEAHVYTDNQALGHPNSRKGWTNNVLKTSSRSLRRNSGLLRQSQAGSSLSRQSARPKTTPETLTKSQPYKRS